VVIISESHFTVHAWPEHDYAAVDIFTCGEKISFDKAIESLKSQLKADNVIVSSLMNRGIVNNNGMERFVPIFEDTSHRYTLSWERRFSDTDAKALSVSIDVYNICCNEESINNFAQTCAEFFNSPNCRVENKIIDGKSVWFLTVSDNLNSFNCKFFEAEAAAYIDVFCCKYIEPRIKWICTCSRYISFR
jgi:S-adenosylmethionine decarboxylase